MLSVGLTGGLASGKTHVAATLRDLGCRVVYADELGHQALAPGGGAYQGVIGEFGSGILDENGSVDRRKLAAQVFGRPDRLAVLNNLVHPCVFRMEEALMRAAAEADPNGIFVVEAAILIEIGSHRRFDRLIVVVCREEQQIERAMKRDHASEAEVRARLARQMPLAEKMKYADYVIDTSGSKENTTEQTREVYRSLRSIAS